MSDLRDSNQEAVRRCPTCDSVVADDALRCIMCGTELPPVPPEPEPEPESSADAAETAVSATPSAAEEPADPTAAEAAAAPRETAVSPHKPVPDVVESVMRERKSSRAFWIATAVVMILLAAGAFYLRNNAQDIALALVPTLTPAPAPPTITPTYTPPATETPPPSATPTFTPTPAPTETPRPTRVHSVASGETLFGLSLFYRIAAPSIAEANGLAPDSALQVGQNLVIPWPTATPPLESLVLEINGETAIADTTDCQIYTIQPGDSVYGLATQFNVPAEAIVAVNRLTEESIQLIQPGDAFCIPEVVFSDTLPPTPGPSPTPTATSFPVGPELLYPINETAVDPPDVPLMLQWVAVKDLAPDEWYMVELADLAQLDTPPLRGFTRDSSFQIPAEWRPVAEQADSHRLRWRVSIVRVTGERSDGQFIYTFGGRASEDAFFTWQGATPTPIPTPTPLPTATPTPE